MIEPVAWIGQDAFAALTAGETICQTMTPKAVCEDDVPLTVIPPGYALVSVEQVKDAERELEMARKIHWLAANDHIFLGSYNAALDTHDDGAYPAINCSDVFVAGADAEALLPNEIDAYVTLCREVGNDAAYAWCAAKTSQNPWRRDFSDSVKKAIPRAEQLIREAVLTAAKGEC